MTVTINASTSSGLITTADTSGVLALQTAGTTALTINASQNVGVGVTPSAWSSGKAIEIGSLGNAFWNNDASENHLTTNAYYNAGWKFGGTGYAQKLTTEAGSYQFNVSTASGTAGNAITFTQAMTLDASGRLLLGTTSAIDSETGLGVVNSTSGNPVTAFRNSRNTSGDVCSKLFVGSNCQNTSSYLLQGGVFGVANVIYIFGNGNVVNTNNSYGALSDVKLKENIVDATPKLADLMQVKVRNYNLIGSTTKQIGVVAQELETVFPAMIDESPDKSAEGNDLGTTSKSVKYSVFVPMLIKAIQEQQVIIESLKARLDAANL